MGKYWVVQVKNILRNVSNVTPKVSVSSQVKASVGESQVVATDNGDY